MPLYKDLKVILKKPFNIKAAYIIGWAKAYQAIKLPFCALLYT